MKPPAKPSSAFQAFSANVGQFAEGIVKLKGKMIERGLTRAWTKCPACGGRTDAVLHPGTRGQKFVIAAACRQCKLSLME